MKKYVFGIDVGGTTVKCGLFTADGEVQDKWEIPTDTADNGCRILKDIADTILAKCEEKAIAKAEVSGIGIAVPGPVLKNGDVPFAVNLHWGYTKVGQILEEYTQIPAVTGNDANVAALGEMWRGGGRGSICGAVRRHRQNCQGDRKGRSVYGGAVFAGRYGGHCGAWGYAARCVCSNFYRRVQFAERYRRYWRFGDAAGHAQRGFARYFYQ